MTIKQILQRALVLVALAFVVVPGRGKSHASKAWAKIVSLPGLGDAVPFQVSMIDVNHGWILDSSKRVWRTQDSGRTWVNLGAPNSRAVDIGFGDLSFGWLRSTADVLVTQDGASHWRQLPIPKSIAGESVNAIWVDARKRFWLGASTWKKDPERSRGSAGSPGNYNGDNVAQALMVQSFGKNYKWQERQLPYPGPLAIKSITFLSSSIGLALADAWILFTSDGGSNWKRGEVRESCVSSGFFQEDTQDDPGSLAAIDDKTAWIAYLSGHLLHTSNSGQSWCEVLATTAERKIKFSGLLFTSASEGWAISMDQDQVFHTYDGGVTWGSTREYGTPFLLRSSNHQGWLVTNLGIFSIEKGLVGSQAGGHMLRETRK